MDISQWIKDTAAATRPSRPKALVQPSESLGVPAAASNPVINASKKRLRARRWSGADSSILVPENTPPEANHKPRNKAKQANPSQSSISSRHGQKPASAASSGTLGISDSEPYRRKKRHKTRADKYELKAKRSRHADADHRDAKAKKKKNGKISSKEKNTVIKGKTAAAVVQNFSAPNVERERLTHGPNMGLFKKGRASSPFRGRGIPDLVFSEMTFLQKRKGLHDAAIPVESGRAGRSKDKARQDEEEISAYFTPSRPPLQQKDVNHAPEPRRHSLPYKERTRTQHPRRHVSALSLTRSSTEPREALRPSVQSRSASATYYSWSTSVEPVRQPVTSSHANPSTKSHNPPPLGPSPASNDGLQKKVLTSTKASRQKSSKDKKWLSNPVVNRSEHDSERRGQDKVKKGQSLRRERRRSRDRDDDALRLRSQSRPKVPTTESLPLPSSPPRPQPRGARQTPLNYDGQAEPAQRENSLETTTAERHPQRRSSSPLGSVLGYCDDALMPEVLEGGQDIPAGRDTGRGQEFAFVAGESRLPQHSALDEELEERDVRRLWRTRQPVYESHADPHQPPRTPDYGLLNSRVAFPCEQQYNWQSEYMDDHFDDDVDHEAAYVQDSGSAAEEAELSTALQEYEDAEFEGASEEGAFKSFWRPNILY